MSNTLVDHYKAVRARMGMTPARPIIKRYPVAAPTLRTPAPSREIRVRKPLWRGQLSSVSIQFTVADYYEISRDEMLSRSRRPKLVRARQVAMYLCRRLTKSSLPQIGAQFRLDHTTVLHAENRVERMMQLSEDIASQVMELQYILTGETPYTYFGA